MERSASHGYSLGMADHCTRAMWRGVPTRSSGDGGSVGWQDGLLFAHPARCGPGQPDRPASARGQGSRRTARGAEVLRVSRTQSKRSVRSLGGRLPGKAYPRQMLGSHLASARMSAGPLDGPPVPSGRRIATVNGEGLPRSQSEIEWTYSGASPPLSTRIVSRRLSGTVSPMTGGPSRPTVRRRPP